MSTFEKSLERIQKKEAKAAVIGAGYVGLPLACALADAGFKTIAVDLDRKKIDALNDGISYIGDISSDRLSKLVKSGKLSGTTEFSKLGDVDAVSICVPTPLNKTKDPDISYIVSAAEGIAPHLKAGALVILESTTYPGTTREAMIPILEKKGGKAGRDFFVCFSPERVDPGNAKFHIQNTPKVIGGYTEECLKLGQAYYSAAIDTVVPVSSCEAAETVKLLENTFRSVNIGLVNELAIMCRKLGISAWEVIGAASTKPFGYMPFYPGPGLGGHCIPIDPLYLAWKMKALDYNARFINLASEINAEMPRFVVDLVQDALNGHKKAINGSKVMVLGTAYKKDISDVRESPALDVIKLLQKKGAVVDYNDPYIPDLHHEGIPLKSVAIAGDALRRYDAVIVTTDHSVYDVGAIVENAQLLVDTRNFTKSIKKPVDKIVKL
jgi:UDP-N-acetyl-D-glucosamine dehydrogenase